MTTPQPKKKKSSIIHVLNLPIHGLTILIHKIFPHKNHRRTKVIVGLSIASIGAFLASIHPVTASYHWMWDGFAYMIHAVGVSPLCSEIEAIFSNES